MADSDISARMRDDWNARAREDAGYYVAFGRREQNDADFFATATEVINILESELRRVPPPQRSMWKALEIGCGPGRLMRPMSRHFAEIHGVDVSDEMIALAREQLRDTPNAHPHLTDGATLAEFADESFDFVYSYAVFQHVPSREVISTYMREIHRVLKTGGFARLQFNGMPRARCADTFRYLVRRAFYIQRDPRIHPNARFPGVGPGGRRNTVYVDHLAQAAAGLASSAG